MKNLIIIAAVGKNRELGYKNDLIWRLKEDLAFFKQTTMGNYIVMGRLTYESMPKNLPGRRYIVISKNLESQDGTLVFNSIPAFLEFAKSVKEDIFVIGGGAIYTALLPYVDKMILTEIDAEFAQADVFFPPFYKLEWDSAQSVGVEENGLIYQRNTYTRK